MIALLAAVTLGAGTPTLLATSACASQGALQTSQPADPALLYRNDGRVRPARLGDLPKANHEKAVMRTVNGCAAPLYVGYRVGR